MKFLKKDASEGTFVSETVLHAALSHPEISFRFAKDGKQQFITPGDGSLRSAVYAVLGREFARDLLDVDGGDELYRVTGLVTPPRACRASRGAQHFFVNGRYVKNRTMMTALENAYKGTVMQGKFPGGVLMLTMPADLVDVNVHPAKTEIRFARESDVFDAVYRAVRGALATPGSGECRFEMGHTAPEEIKTPPTTAPAAPPPAAHPVPGAGGFKTVSAAEYRAMAGLVKDIPARKLPGAAATLTVESEKPVYQVTPRTVTPLAPLASMTGEESVLDILPDIPEPEKTSAPQQCVPAEAMPEPQPQPEPEQTALSALPQAEQTTLTPPPATEELRLVGEVFKTYIITERGGELCLIDKHAAHERILFEKLAKDYGSVAAQMLLVPVQVNLTAAEKLAVLQNTELLADAGIEVEDFGGATVVVRAVPADVAVDDVEDMLVELAAHLAEGGRDALREKTEWVLHSIACRAAIKAGDRTGSAEMLALAQKIMDGTVPPFCPHGRPCVLKLTRKELEKQFGRLV